MKIGNIELRHGLFLAPMAGVTDHAFRALCVSCGAECVTGELISAKGVTYGDKKTDTLAALYPDERPAAIQLFGHEPDILARAAAEIMRFSPDFIDINMGCPVPKLVRNGDGSALMRDPELCERIVYAVCEAVDVPVTVKIRKAAMMKQTPRRSQSAAKPAERAPFLSMAERARRCIPAGRTAK